jgi:hypothetical protein
MRPLLGFFPAGNLHTVFYKTTFRASRYPYYRDAFLHATAQSFISKLVSIGKL